MAILNFRELKEAPVLYVSFLSLVALTILFSKLDKNHAQTHKEDKEEIKEWKSKDAQKDSIIHKLYYLNGIKAVVDSVKTKAYGQ